jgi:hypothetical protein
VASAGSDAQAHRRLVGGCLHTVAHHAAHIARRTCAAPCTRILMCARPSGAACADVCDAACCPPRLCGAGARWRAGARSGARARAGAGHGHGPRRGRDAPPRA